jgi:hypothetical protein
MIMTKDKAQKTAARQRMAETGEPYSVARRSVANGPAEDRARTGMTPEEQYALEAEAAGVPAAEIQAQEASFLAQEAADLAREQAGRARERADLAGEAADQADERADLAQEAADLAEDWADEEEQNRTQGQAYEMRRLADEMRERADRAEEAADLAEEHADLAQEHADEAAEWAGMQHDGEKLIVRLRQWRPDLTRRGPEEGIPVPPPPPSVPPLPLGRRGRPAERPSAVGGWPGPALPWAACPLVLPGPGPAGPLAPGQVVARAAAPMGWGCNSHPRSPRGASLAAATPAPAARKPSHSELIDD